MKPFGDPSYGMTRHLPGTDPEAAKAAVRDALAAEGFGVLAELDFGGTLRSRLGVDFPPYVVLGACNPALAHRALQAEPAIGLLLPCNVVVASDGAGGSTVSIADPDAMLGLVDRPEVRAVAAEARERLGRALAALPEPARA